MKSNLKIMNYTKVKKRKKGDIKRNSLGLIIYKEELILSTYPYNHLFIWTWKRKKKWEVSHQISFGKINLVLEKLKNIFLLNDR